MKGEPIDVVIIGAGIGGLALAQGLKKNGVSFSIYKREFGPTARPKQYRLHIDDAGVRALRDCLTEGDYEYFFKESSEFGHAFSILDEQLSPLVTLQESDSGAHGTHRCMARESLLHTLSHGIQDTIQYGKAFRSYEIIGDHVRSSWTTGQWSEETFWWARTALAPTCASSSCQTLLRLTRGSSPSGVECPSPLRSWPRSQAELLNGPALIMPGQASCLSMSIWKSDTGGCLGAAHSTEELMAQDYLLLLFAAKKEDYHLPDEPKKWAVNRC